MNIAVIAASGRSGRAFVEQALAAGHVVRAGVHGKGVLSPQPRLTVVVCDATKERDLLRLIDGQEAVVSFIGHTKESPRDVQTDMVRLLRGAMEAKKVTRFVSLTGTGVRFPGDKITLVDRILNAGITLIDPARVQDGRNHVSLLRQTELDWTVIRVLKLQNSAPGLYVLRQNGPTKPFVGRAEVAKAVLEVLEQRSFVRQAPIISPIR